MATPSNRIPVRVARGTKANIDIAVAAGDLKEGEVVYVTDENAIYVIEGGVLTQTGADLTATSIDALSDVDTTTAAPTDGQVLVWSNVDGEWQPGDLSIDALSDVDTTTAAPADGQALVWNDSASQWEPGGVSGEIEWTLTANGTTDYIFAGAGFAGTETDPAVYVTRGQTYKFTNGMGSHPFQIQSTQGAGGTAYNDGITNNAVSNGTLVWEVRMDAPSTLYYQCTSHADMNGTIYVLDEGSSVTSIDNLSDVDTTTVAPTDGQALVWDNANSKWEPGTVASGSVASIDDIGDVDTVTAPPTDGQALVWSATDSQWEPGSVAGGVSSVNSETGAVVLEVEDLNDVSYPPVNTTFNGTWNQISNISTTSAGTMAIDTDAMRFATVSNSVDTLPAWEDWCQNVLGITFPASSGNSVAVSPSVSIVVNRDGVDYTLAVNTVWNRDSGTYPNVQLNFDDASSFPTSASGNPPVYLPSMRTAVGGVSDNQILQYDTATTSWGPVDPTIDLLSDVDTSTVAPTDGQALVWNATDSEWQPGTVSGGGAVTSVNTLTGAVSLGIEEMDDFANVADIGSVSYLLNGDTTNTGTWVWSGGIVMNNTASDGSDIRDFFPIGSSGQTFYVEFSDNSTTQAWVSSTVTSVTQQSASEVKLVCDTTNFSGTFYYTAATKVRFSSSNPSSLTAGDIVAYNGTDYSLMRIDSVNGGTFGSGV